MPTIVKDCKKHGPKTEAECTVRNKKLADGRPVKRYECKACANEAKRAWLEKNPDKKRDYKFKDWPSIVGDGPLRCATCKSEKKQSEFHKHMLKNSTPRCAICMKACLKKYKENNPESFTQTQKEHRAKNKEHYSKVMHKSKLKIHFDMTPEEYADLLSSQNNVCAVCRKPESRKQNGTICRLSVDHCHKEGIIRGLLCNNCNLMLGRFNHDLKILQSAMEYLKGQGFKRP